MKDKPALILRSICSIVQKRIHGLNHICIPIISALKWVPEFDDNLQIKEEERNGEKEKTQRRS